MSDDYDVQEDGQYKGVFLHDTHDGVIGLLCLTTVERRRTHHHDSGEDEFGFPTPPPKSPFSWLEEGFSGTPEEWADEPPSEDEIDSCEEFVRCFDRRT